MVLGRSARTAAGEEHEEATLSEFILPQIHPYVSIAITVLSAIPKVRFAMRSMLLVFYKFIAQMVVTQMERDRDIDALIKDMSDLFETLKQDGEEDLKSRYKDDQQAKLLEQMFSQIIECCHFIRDYAQDKSFCTLCNNYGMY